MSKIIKLKKGFMLLELLIVCLIIAVLALSGTSLYHRLSVKFSAERALGHFEKMLDFAKQTALSHKEYVTVCASNTGKKCEGGWSNGQLLFIDYNHNGFIDLNDEIIEYFPAKKHNAIIQWHGFNSSQYLTVSPYIKNRSMNGYFSYCNQRGLSNTNWILTINRLGYSHFKKGTECAAR